MKEQRLSLEYIPLYLDYADSRLLYSVVEDLGEWAGRALPMLWIRLAEGGVVKTWEVEGGPIRGIEIGNSP